MEQDARVVHLIFKTHLDIGFTDFAYNVVQTYFEQFIPQAIQTARQLRDTGRSERFVWTTGSWLIYEYLEQADAAGRRAMEAAIEAGDIVWHGLPFTTHTELMDVALFKVGLSLSQRLDKRFGKQTIAAKMTDVPGHTRGIVPLLAEAGIRLLHLGSNPASTPPDVPPVFVWRDPPSGAEIAVMYQKGAYGDATRVPGLGAALAFAHTNDNHGPQKPGDVMVAYEQYRERFPDAEIRGSTMDAFAKELMPVVGTLPVVTQEMGDTWIQGVGTDPAKVARYRELLRLRREWLATGKVRKDDPTLDRFSRKLMMVAEHTWGMDEKVHLADTALFTLEDLRYARQTERFQRFESSWAEKRGYVDEALMALKETPLIDEARRRLSGLTPKRPKQDAFKAAHGVTTIETAQFVMVFDRARGVITGLRHKASGREWASEQHPLGLVRYQTFSEADYDRYWRDYIVNKRQTRAWSLDDNTKRGMGDAGVSRMWEYSVAELGASEGHLVAELVAPEEAQGRFGCPRRVYLDVRLVEDGIDIDLQWFEKPASRLPEAVWLSFMPAGIEPKGWMMDKLGEAISPLEVIRNGNRKLHAVDSGVTYRDRRGAMVIETLDAPLVAPGEPSLLHFNNRQPPMKQGMHFNLYNNVWGTNFPMWYDENARFRFRLRIRD